MLQHLGFFLFSFIVWYSTGTKQSRMNLTEKVAKNAPAQFTFIEVISLLLQW